MAKKWSYSAGEKGNTVTVYERKRGGNVYARAHDPSLQDGKGGYRRRSLGFEVRGPDGTLIEEAVDRARSYADRQAAKLREGEAEIRGQRLTIARLFKLYRRHRLPQKSEGEQKVNKRQMKAWQRFLGPGKAPEKISLREWETYTENRSSGAIDARGRPVEEEKRRPVRARTVAKDLDFLSHVLRWATRWRDDNGRYLMSENPVRGFEVPREKNPRRPIASQDRYEAIRAHTDEVTMVVTWNGRKEEVRSHLSEIFQLVNHTGRRISSVCALRHSDLRLDRTESAPFGAIRWRASEDKMGYDSVVPINEKAREAVERARTRNPGIGDAPLFPAPENRQEPIRKDVTDKWLREAEELAELEPQEGGLWHPYRRKWVTERKHLPDRDVAEAGGWQSLDALRQCYQQADERTMLDVVLGGGELREVGS